MENITIETYLDSCEKAIGYAAKQNRLGVLTHLREAEAQRRALVNTAKVRLEADFIGQVLQLWDSTMASIPLAWKHQVAAFFA